MRQMVLELNASDDRGIDVVREQIKTFASTKQIFTNNSSSTSIAGYKLIILDEADAMTSTAQMALRRIMEKYTANTRFCIIANYTHKLSPALLSRCTRFRFSPLKERDIRVLVDKVITEENVQITSDATDALVRLSKGDMRRALNVLQACHASSMSRTPLYPLISSDHRRHTPPHQRHPEDRRERHQARPDYRDHNLRMHSLTAPRRHNEDHEHAPADQGRDILFADDQFAQVNARLGIGGYHHSACGAVEQDGCPGPGYDNVVGWFGGGGISVEWWWRRGRADGGSCWCC